MPDGKPAGQRCAQLTADLRCALFGSPLRPSVCRSLRPNAAMCGPDRVHALQWLARLEQATMPEPCA